MTQPKDGEGAEALLGCPFCGGEANANGSIRYSENHDAWWSDGSRVRDAFFVNCVTCVIDNKGLVGHQTKAEAIAAWNRRAPPATPVRGGGGEGSSNASRAAMGPVAHVAPEAEPSAPKCAHIHQPQRNEDGLYDALLPWVCQFCGNVTEMYP